MAETNLYSALLSAKRNMSPPVKNKKAVYGRYADLEAVLQAVEPPLAEVGLVLTQHGQVIEGKPMLVTRLTHVDTGDYTESAVPLLSKNPNDPQQLGSAITYARRYGITALLSVVADDDDDGNTSSGRERDGSKKKAPKKEAEGVTEEQIQDALSVKGGLSGKMVDALLTEYERAGIPKTEIVPEIQALLGREFGQLSELTEAEARAAAGHARKVKREDVERLT